MQAEALKNERIKDFVEYCKRHRMELDDSFLYDEDLRDFTPNDENPTYIITNQQGEIKATASLIIDEYYRRGSKARFRIFHSEVDNAEYYKLLMQAILKHTEGLDNIFVFIPAINKKLIEFIEGLKFIVERYAFVLVRDELEVPEIKLSEGYSIRPFKLGEDEETWCKVRNASFANLKGSETPKTPEDVVKMISSDDNIEGGSMILYHNERPVGVVRCANDEYEDLPIMNIGPLAIIPEYQGKGLGRMLLRTSLKFAKDNGYNRTILSVNAENERAKSLYIQEGFKQVEAAVCYEYKVNSLYSRKEHK